MANRCFDELRDGKESALSHYIQAYSSTLGYYAFRLVHRKETAEEIVSDSFYKLWEARDKIESNDHLKAFLYTVTRNACLNHLEADRKVVQYEAEPNTAIPTPEPDPLSGILHAELMGLIYAEIDNLPAQQGEIFRLSYLDGLTNDEIAQRLGTSLNNIYVALSTARKTLQRVFRDKPLILYLLYLQLSLFHSHPYL